MKRFYFLFVLLASLAISSVFFAAETTANAAGTNAVEATTYQIRNVKYGDLLRPRDANHANGTPIVLYSAQPWKCMTWRLQPAGETAFLVRNLFTGKTFHAAFATNAQPADVTQVPLPKNASEGPAWRFVLLDDGHYKITDDKSGKVLTAVKKTGEYSAIIAVAPWSNLDDQKWTLEKIDPQQLTM